MVRAEGGAVPERRADFLEATEDAPVVTRPAHVLAEALLHLLLVVPRVRAVVPLPLGALSLEAGKQECVPGEARPTGVDLLSGVTGPPVAPPVLAEVVAVRRGLIAFDGSRPDCAPEQARSPPSLVLAVHLSGSRALDVILGVGAGNVVEQVGDSHLRHPGDRIAVVPVRGATSDVVHR